MTPAETERIAAILWQYMCYIQDQDDSLNEAEAAAAIAEMLQEARIDELQNLHLPLFSIDKSLPSPELYEQIMTTFEKVTNDRIAALKSGAAGKDAV